ncbi:MAG: D-amino-acid transaminase, partial [Trebonia sp.]
HIEDRGYQYADGVYEVIAVANGKLVDEEPHFVRLHHSLSELRIEPPIGDGALKIVMREVVRRNGVDTGIVYLQITRGVAPRDHAFPARPVRPSIVITAKPVDMAAAEAKAARGIGVVTTPETRWARCDIKTIALLPNVLAKQTARESGAGEAWFVDERGLVTEGASSNAWIVDADGVLRTRDLNANILRGITRKSLMELIAREGLQVSERPFSAEEAKQAREAFITGAGSLVTPVVSIDGAPVGDGQPGPVATGLRASYLSEASGRAA